MYFSNLHKKYDDIFKFDVTRTKHTMFVFLQKLFLKSIKYFAQKKVFVAYLLVTYTLMFLSYLNLDMVPCITQI